MNLITRLTQTKWQGIIVLFVEASIPTLKERVLYVGPTSHLNRWMNGIHILWQSHVLIISTKGHPSKVFVLFLLMNEQASHMSMNFFQWGMWMIKAKSKGTRRRTPTPKESCLNVILVQNHTCDSSPLKWPDNDWSCLPPYLFISRGCNPIAIWRHVPSIQKHTRQRDGWHIWSYMSEWMVSVGHDDDEGMGVTASKCTSQTHKKVRPREGCVPCVFSWIFPLLVE